jgi:hypothetical protein
VKKSSARLRWDVVKKEYRDMGNSLGKNVVLGPVYGEIREWILKMIGREMRTLFGQGFIKEIVLPLVELGWFQF